MNTSERTQLINEIIDFVIKNWSPVIVSEHTGFFRRTYSKKLDNIDIGAGTFERVRGMLLTNTELKIEKI